MEENDGNLHGDQSSKPAEIKPNTNWSGQDKINWY